MKKILISLATAIVLATSGVSVGFAQDDGAPQFRPVEMWACSLRDGKDRGDLDSVYESTVAASGDEAYAAFHLEPYYAGGLVDNFDFLYLGVWADGSTMGTNLTGYFANGDDADEEWNETLDCSSLMFASTRIQDNAGDGTGDGNFMLTVSDCNVGHGRTSGQAMAALNRFNDYRLANGSTVGSLAWFPVYGGGDAEFDFKRVHVYSDIKALGDDFSWFVDNAAYNTEGDLLDGLLSCDEARVYIGSTIMNNLN
jgi:hypothetical protein